MVPGELLPLPQMSQRSRKRSSAGSQRSAQRIGVRGASVHLGGATPDFRTLLLQLRSDELTPRRAEGVHAPAVKLSWAGQDPSRPSVTVGRPDPTSRPGERTSCEDGLEQNLPG